MSSLCGRPTCLSFLHRSPLFCLQYSYSAAGLHLFSLFSPTQVQKQWKKKKKKCCNRNYYLSDTSCPWEAIAEAKQIQDLLKRNSWKPSKCWCAAVKPFICTSNAPSNTSVWLKNFPCSSLRCIILSLTPLSTRFFVWKWKMTRLPFPDNINNLWNPFLL